MSIGKPGQKFRYNNIKILLDFYDQGNSVYQL